MSVRVSVIALFLLSSLHLAEPAAAQSEAKDTIRSIGGRKPPSAHLTPPARSTKKTNTGRVAATAKPKPKPVRQTAKPTRGAITNVIRRPEAKPRLDPQEWDLAREFSTTTNPRGPWSFGSTIELEGPLELFQEVSRVSRWYASDQLVGWSPNDTTITPYIMKNVSSAAWNFGSTEAGGGTVSIEPGKVALHPRSPDRYVVVEWKAPRKGIYLVRATFTRAELVQGRNSNYFVSKNRVLLEGATGLLTGYGQADSSASYVSPRLSLEPGDTLRFAVGFGTDGTSNADLNVLDVFVRSSEGQ